MEEYEKINNEIKQLMNTTVKKEGCELVDSKTEEKNVDQLIKILSDLIRVYKDIQFMLESNDNEGIKNKLLSDDIKISLVCESLMKVLKDECTEKKEAYKLLKEEKNRFKALSMENEELKHKLRKIESDMQYLSNGNKELNRIVQDQKARVQSFKEKAELETRGADTIRTINKELESLRQKALAKNEILVKEMNVLRSKIEEKDKTIKKINEEIKINLREAKATGDKCAALEKGNIALRKKLESKEEALDLCNSELAKLITQNKRFENTFEDLKSKTAYYERLYKAINKQNEYLNEQLAKLINVDNADRIEISQNEKDEVKTCETLVTATSDLKKLKGYKKRLRKYKRRYFTTQEEVERNREELKEIQKTIQRIKTENKRLQEEKERAVESNNKVTDTLLNKVEGLLEKNKEYQRLLFEHQDENTRVDESFKTVVEEVPLRKRQSKDLDTMFNDIKLKNTYNTKLKVHDFDSSTLFVDDVSDRKYQRSFKLHNDYETGKENTKPHTEPRIDPHTERGGLAQLGPNQQAELVPTTHSSLRVPNNFYSSLVLKPEEPTPKVTYSDFKLTEKESEDAEVQSIDSGKSLQTTSTLKEMRKKTEHLQNKFDDLEKQLEEIKQSDDPHPKKLHDQIKAYTDYYYSDYLDLSNEDDFM